MIIHKHFGESMDVSNHTWKPICSIRSAACLGWEEVIVVDIMGEGDGRGREQSKSLELGSRGLV